MYKIERLNRRNDEGSFNATLNDRNLSVKEKRFKDESERGTELTFLKFGRSLPALTWLTSTLCEFEFVSRKK